MKKKSQKKKLNCIGISISLIALFLPGQLSAWRARVKSIDNKIATVAFEFAKKVKPKEKVFILNGEKVIGVGHITTISFTFFKFKMKKGRAGVGQVVTNRAPRKKKRKKETSCKIDGLFEHPNVYFTACEEPEFVVQEGVVHDRKNNLVWTRCSLSKKKVPKENRDSCALAVREDFFTWKEARTACKELSYNGRRDWQLPDIAQLHTLIKSRQNPSIDTNVFPKTSSDLYWSKTVKNSAAPEDRGKFNVWRIYFTGGHIAESYATRFGAVRCVAVGK